MHINRDNYENFFLLYVDGELCAADKKMVEEFAAANADLAHELETLQATVLPAELPSFEEKNSLYRPVPVDNILEEKLLLKADDELPVKELAALDALLTGDENVRGAFADILSAKLDPAEKIIFADKHLLYKERDNVVVGRFLKLAAAAVILGFVLFFSITKMNKKNAAEVAVAGKNAIKKTGTPNEMTHTAPSKNDTQQLATVKPGGGAVQDPAAVINSDNNNNTNSGIAKNSSALPVENAHKPVDVLNRAIDPKNGTNAVVVKNSSFALKNNNRKAVNELNRLISPKNADLPNEEPAMNTLAKKDDHVSPLRQQAGIEDQQKQAAVATIAEKPKQQLALIDNNIVPLENVYAKAASFSSSEKTDNKILYMDEDEVKRSKVGGFFRRVKRFAERTARIKPGSTLRIANFELAAN